MSTIVDFKIINLTLKGDSIEENITKFNHTINNYLQKGYTLHGNTTADGSNPRFQVFSQPVVKYSGSTPGPLITAYTLQWCHYGVYENDSICSVFERNILDEIRNGYSLHGDLIYVYCNDSHTTHCYSQALVKISQPVVTFTEDLVSMRSNITKHGRSLADFQQEVANHTKVIAELRLDLDTQEKIIRRQKRLIDELFNPVKPVTPVENLLDI